MGLRPAVVQPPDTSGLAHARRRPETPRVRKLVSILCCLARVRPWVRVTGVGFFDFAHGQRGAAPNEIELHPVLEIEFR